MLTKLRLVILSDKYITYFYSKYGLLITINLTCLLKIYFLITWPKKMFRSLGLEVNIFLYI